MVNIEQYILLPLKTRRAHINLREHCIERGKEIDDVYTSIYCKGLLAHLLDTTIPRGRKIYICHACNNGRCSNPNHIYWGTPRENRLDWRNSPTFKSIWQYSVEKYGVEETLRRYRLRAKKKVKIIDTSDARKIPERNSQFGTCWVRKEGKEVKIKNTELQLFQLSGWEKGRAIKLFARNSLR